MTRTYLKIAGRSRSAINVGMRDWMGSRTQRAPLSVAASVETRRAISLYRSRVTTRRSVGMESAQYSLLSILGAG